VFAPPPSTLFTGQSQYIISLKAHFDISTEETRLPEQRSLLLYGMGGVGKTQICLKFIQEVSDQ